MSKVPLFSMRQCLDRPDLFGGILAGESWTAWRVLLIAICGERLTDAERIIFEQLTGRPHEPAMQVEEAILVIGRRGGKTRAIAMLAVYFACVKQYQHLLAPGERAVVQILSATKDQAAKAKQYISGALASVEAFADLVENETADTISLSNSIDIIIAAANFRTVRSVTAVLIVADEVAYWRNENSSNPDDEILAAARPSLATTGGLLVQISSPYAKRGELYKSYRQNFGPDGDPLVLVVRAATKTMNPGLPQSVIDRAKERDPAKAAAEYEAVFRSDLESFIAREAVEACVILGRHELPPRAGVRYHGFVDPSGGGGKDSYSMAIAHREGDIVVLDLIREVRPPLSTDAVTAEFAKVFKAYRIKKIVGDRYAGLWPTERFKAHEISYEATELFRSDIYKELLPLLSSQRVELLDHQKMVDQIANLERRIAPGGKDQINHVDGGHDDVANSAGGAVWLASAKKAPMIISQAAIERSMQPDPNYRNRGLHRGLYGNF